MCVSVFRILFCVSLRNNSARCPKFCAESLCVPGAQYCAHNRHSRLVFVQTTSQFLVLSALSAAGMKFRGVNCQQATRRARNNFWAAQRSPAAAVWQSMSSRWHLVILLSLAPLGRRPMEMRCWPLGEMTRRQEAARLCDSHARNLLETRCRPGCIDFAAAPKEVR